MRSRWPLAALAMSLGCQPAASPPPTVVVVPSAPAPSSAPAPTSRPADAGERVAPSSSSSTPLPPGCMRQRTSFQGRCSGAAPPPGVPSAIEVEVCDECLSDADCRAAAGGRCLQTGGHPCAGPARNVCKYPSAACGGAICVERPPPYPPSRAPGPGAR